MEDLMLNNSIAIKNEKGLTSNALKIIAIIAMTIDHIALILFPRFSTNLPVLAMHVIGRLTAPIMIFLIVEGYYHTRNLKKYLFRLFILAIISHFAYAIAFDKDFIPFRKTVFDQTSVIWTYLLGVLALAIHKTETINTWIRRILVFIIVWLAFPADWSTPAALAILYMGIDKGNFKRQMIRLVACIAVYSIIYCIFVNRIYGLIQMLIILAIPLLYQYNGQRGTWKGMKWFFYIYYPAHLIILGIIRIFLLQKGVEQVLIK
jgi:hypothetical protein